MKAQQVVFIERDKVALQEFEFDLSGLAPDEVALRTEYSLVSPGTELACLAGIEHWAPFPWVPGYAGVGEVLAVGEAVRHVRPGDRAFAYTRHASHVRTRGVVAAVPAGLDPALACFARMGAVSITALRASQAELGDYVAVIGLGLVGNLAAQLFNLAGCDVIGLDVAAHRRELAGRLGARYLVDPTAEDAKARVAAITGGGMCGTVVEAIGAPAVAEHAAELAGKLGEVILLGSPRHEHTADLNAFLNNIHLWERNCVTFKGAHEWRYPLKRVGEGQVKHSIERNVEILLRYIADGRLQVAPLHSHTLSPAEAPVAYVGLREHKDAYLGVVYDWSRLA
jgi:2-desacetyl-2-hydroxyethyl bacteriochlorophyllide A dehydrogenase